MKRFAAKATVALAVLAALGAHYAAAGVLDDLSAIDINDYGIGLGTSYSSGVYVDQESSSYLYPYVTKYTPMEFDESVLMMRAGGYGVRWLGDSGWEVGALARPQTLGYGSNSSPSLDGLDDRGWTLEVGPTLGWRRGSIRVDWTVFADLLGHHDGTNQLLRVSRPFLFLKGYIVPELGLNHYASDYVDYYFGVPPTNVGAASPYVGASASGPSLAVQWGVRVAPHWLVTGRVAVESLGTGITDSPIVAASERRSVSLHFAYDGTLFDELAQPQWDNEHERELADRARAHRGRCRCRRVARADAPWRKRPTRLFDQSHARQRRSEHPLCAAPSREHRLVSRPTRGRGGSQPNASSAFVTSNSATGSTSFATRKKP